MAAVHQYDAEAKWQMEAQLDWGLLLVLESFAIETFGTTAEPGLSIVLCEDGAIRSDNLAEVEHEVRATGREVKELQMGWLTGDLPPSFTMLLKASRHYRINDPYFTVRLDISGTDRTKVFDAKAIAERRGAEYLSNPTLRPPTKLVSLVASEPPSPSAPAPKPEIEPATTPSPWWVPDRRAIVQNIYANGLWYILGIIAVGLLLAGAFMRSTF